MPTDFDIRVLYMKLVEEKLASGDYVDAQALADAIRDHGDAPLPPAVADYLCRFLEGKVPKPKGRHALPWYERKMLRAMQRHVYHRYRDWLTARKKRYGRLFDWPGLQNYTKAGPRPMPPSELAARLTAKRFGKSEDAWRSIQTEISSKE